MGILGTQGVKQVQKPLSLAIETMSISRESMSNLSSKSSIEELNVKDQLKPVLALQKCAAQTDATVQGKPTNSGTDTTLSAPKLLSIPRIKGYLIGSTC